MPHTTNSKLCMNLLNECYQNSIELRKFEKNIELLEKEKESALSKINGEKHLTKIKYKTFLMQKNKGEYSNLEIEPGLDTESALKYISIAEDGLDEKEDKMCSKSLANVNQTSQNINSIQSCKDLLFNIEKDFKMLYKGKCDKTSEDILELCSELDMRVKTLSNSVMLARNDYEKTRVTTKIHDQGDSFESLYRAKSQKSCNRYFRKNTKANCEACEFRIKCIEMETASKPSKSNNKVPWKIVPSGKYASVSQYTGNDGMRRSFSAHHHRSDKINTQINSTLTTHSKQHQPRNPSKSAMPRMQLLMLQSQKEQEEAQHKVTDFLQKLPNGPPQEPTWRTSKGNVVMWSQKKGNHYNAHAKEEKLLNDARNSLEMLGDSSKLSRQLDKNSFESLKNCRYLRSFKSDYDLN